MPSCGVRPSVHCPSHSCILSKRINIFLIFFTFGRMLVFLYKRYGIILTGLRGPPNCLTGASNAGGVDKNRDSRQISGYRIDDCYSAIKNCDSSSMQFIAQTATHR